MSPLYEKQVADLTEWFKSRISNLGKVEMSREDYRAGTDKLPDRFKPVIKEAINTWETERGYELSYNQLCQAFFAAGRAVDVISVINDPLAEIAP